jgi:UDP-galactopyranose mutase
MEYDVIIIGAGLSGCVMAEQFATLLNKKVLIIEKRDHIGGNCYDYIDAQTGLLINKYGAHLFHTNDEGVWKYVQRFGEWVRYDHKVVAYVNGRNVPVPVNMETVNVLCDEKLQTEEETKEWFINNTVMCDNASNNSEETALMRVGNVLYQKIFKPYTIKQWNKDPKELDPSVLERIPVRYSMDSRYFSDKYQGVPEKGYTKLMYNMISHPNITVQLNTEYYQSIHKCNILIYTGPIDTYYASHGFPKLEYRSLRFEIERHFNVGYVQPHMVINYPSLDYPFTRIIEYKHLPTQPNTDNSILIKEYPSDYGEPYYPVPTKRNTDLYEMYKSLSKDEKNVHMIGRLANYKYFNMDQAIRNALDYFKATFNNHDGI